MVARPPGLDEAEVDLNRAAVPFRNSRRLNVSAAPVKAERENLNKNLRHPNVPAAPFKVEWENTKKRWRKRNRLHQKLKDNR